MICMRISAIFLMYLLSRYAEAIVTPSDFTESTIINVTEGLIKILTGLQDPFRTLEQMTPTLEIEHKMYLKNLTQQDNAGFREALVQVRTPNSALVSSFMETCRVNGYPIYLDSEERESSIQTIDDVILLAQNGRLDFDRRQAVKNICSNAGFTRPSEHYESQSYRIFQILKLVHSERGSLTDTRSIDSIIEQVFYRGNNVDDFLPNHYEVRCEGFKALQKHLKAAFNAISKMSVNLSFTQEIRNLLDKISSNSDTIKNSGVSNLNYNESLEFFKLLRHIRFFWAMHFSWLTNNQLFIGSHMDWTVSYDVPKFARFNESSEHIEKIMALIGTCELPVSTNKWIRPVRTDTLPYDYPNIYSERKFNECTAGDNSNLDSQIECLNLKWCEEVSWLC